MWATLSEDSVQRLPRSLALLLAATSNHSSADLNREAEAWKNCIHELLAFRLFEDNWDGQGAKAPPPDLVDSAIILAVLLTQKGVAPPACTVPGVNGTVAIEWECGELATAEIEVIEPYLADFFALVPGKPGENFQLRAADVSLVDEASVV